MIEKFKKIFELYKKDKKFANTYEDEKELFKILLFILKKNESGYNDNFFKDFDKNKVNSITFILKNKFGKKLKNIKYVNKGIDLDKYNYVEYQENEDRIYLLDKKDMDDIKKYQINPYSGRVIKKTFFNKHFPNIVYEGDKIEKYCSGYALNIKIILNWINNFLFSYEDDLLIWINRFKIEYMNILYHRNDPKILKELLKYKKCEKYKIYRGINFDATSHYKFNDFMGLKNNDEIIYNSVNFSSWSLDKSIAYNFSTDNECGFVMSAIVDYKDILIDTCFFSQKTNNKIVMSSEKEIILLPGKYKTKLSYVNMFKDQETLDLSIKIHKFFIKNKINYYNFKIKNKKYFLIIERDFKSIHIYFDIDNKIELFYKENIYLLDPRETYKIEFKNLPDMYLFLEQNIKFLISISDKYYQKLNINEKKPIKYHKHDYLNPYICKKLEIDTDSYEYPKILEGYYVKNIEETDIESSFDLEKYFNNYSNEIKKNTNILKEFILYLRFVDLVNTHFVLLNDEYTTLTKEMLKYYENLFLNNDETKNLYLNLYDTHIKPLELKLN